MDMPFSLPSAYALESARSWGRTQGLTVTPTGRAAQGRREFLSFRPGFYLAIGHVRHLEHSREVYRSGDFIKLHFRLEGESQVGQPDARATQTVHAMSVSTLLQPPGSTKEEVFASEVHERSVTLCCSRSFLVEELGLAAQQHLHGPFGAFVQSTPAHFELLRFPLAPAQHDIAAALLDDARDDAFRGLYAEGKAFELLHGFLTSRLGDRDAPCGSYAPDMQTLQAREAIHAREGLAQVKHYIDANLDQPFDMRALARRFGLSESRLARRFRQAFGLALFAYVAQARLARARSLLEAGRMSITEVALEVGYGHAANFSTAFKRHFGITPQGLRKAAREGRVPVM
jgi:AraC-like DNA-binding protein